MKVTISIEKRHAYIIIGLLVFGIGILGVNAAVDKNSAWHSANQIDGLGGLAIKNSISWSDIDISTIPEGLSDGDDVGSSNVNTDYCSGGVCAGKLQIGGLPVIIGSSCSESEWGTIRKCDDGGDYYRFICGCISGNAREQKYFNTYRWDKLNS